MRDFFRELWRDLKTTPVLTVALLASLAIAVNGYLLFCPSTPFDFNATKGSSFQVFLTYYFMKRPGQGLIGAIFDDFSPLWNNGIGMLFLILSFILLDVLGRRQKWTGFTRFIFCALWVSTPFFFNRSTAVHVWPGDPIAFCSDALVLLLVQSLRKSGECRWSKLLAAVFCAAFSISVYQAQANLLLTALLGMLAIDPPKKGVDLGNDLVRIIGILLGGVILWTVIAILPVALVKFLGVMIPPSGGAHDALFWLAPSLGIAAKIKGLFVGILLNWGYNALFLVGLRIVWLFFIMTAILSIAMLIKREWIVGACLAMFALSIFAFPVLQCFSGMLRIYFCFMPFIAFGGIISLRFAQNNRKATWIIRCLLVLFVVAMGHETSSLYYYNWKVKELDRMHMFKIAEDLWTKYGTKIDKPVALIGGFDRLPTCWNDMRPFAFLPLLNDVHSSYSNITSDNVPREFYMTAREKVGLVLRSPDVQRCIKLSACRDLVESHPAYPKPGYIFETPDEILVNLGESGAQWSRFSYDDYRSPNEKLLIQKLKLQSFDRCAEKLTQPLRRLAESYRWTWDVGL